MIQEVKQILRPIHRQMRSVSNYHSVNWIKTLYFNFKKFPFTTAAKLPVYIYGSINLRNLSGQVTINGPIRTAMIGIGQRFELAQREKGTAEISLFGKLVFNGPAHFGKDVFLFVGPDAYCEFGYMSALGSDVKVVCTQKITIGEWSGIAYESQLIDTNSHPMKNSSTGENYPMAGTISIGSHNTIANRTTVMFNTQTPDYCIVASNSVCNRDYTQFGNKILIGGIPAKLLKTDYIRDWEAEYDALKEWKKVPKGM